MPKQPCPFESSPFFKQRKCANLDQQRPDSATFLLQRLRAITMNPSKSKSPLKFYNILGGPELRQSRFMVGFMAVTLVLVATVFFLVRMNIELQRTNVALQNSRIMYGFPNAEGIFISENQIPERHIKAFVTTFLNNYYNFTPESATANAVEALRMMSPRLRAVQEENLMIVARQSAEQQITQVFTNSTPYTITIEPGQGYVVSFIGERNRATLSRVFDKKRYEIKFLIKPVKPSKHFEWAVVIDDFNIQEK
jgi:hypothetical protein